jgi:Glycosyl transferase family 2
MARSGTSAITRLLNLLGMELGPQEGLLAPIEDENPRGFFEHRQVIRVNEELLRRLGGSWREPPRLVAGWHQAPALDDLRARARELIAVDFADARVWGFKDPRTSLTLPFWDSLISDASFVVCHRRPLDSARSLERRDGLRLDDAAALWTRYTASSLAHTAGRRRIIIGYEELFSNRESLLKELAAFLGRPEGGEDIALRGAVETWVERDLRHHACTLRELVEHPAVSAEAQALNLLMELTISTRATGRQPDGDDLGSTVEALDGMARTLVLRDATRAFAPGSLEPDKEGPMSAPGGGRQGAALSPDTQSPDRPYTAAPSDSSSAVSELKHARDPTQSSMPERGGLLASVVIVLTGDPWAAMGCLESLAELESRTPSHEIIVVDNASVGLRSIMATLGEGIKLLRLSHRVSALDALRAGVQAAAGEVVVCLPSPACLAPNALTVLYSELGKQAALGSVDPDTPFAHPTTSRAIALRRSAMPAVDAPDAQAMGALCFELARLGPIRACATAHVSAPHNPLCRRGPGVEEIEVSVIIPTLDAASDEVRGCLRDLHGTLTVAHEVILVDNGAPPQGFSAPVNAALNAARGRHVVIMNDDVRVLDGWWEPLAAALDAGNPLVFPLTVEGHMRWDIAAWCFAMSREAITRMSWRPGQLFDPLLVVWCQDLDLRNRMSALGATPLCVPESRIRHGGSRTVRPGSRQRSLQHWIHAQTARDTSRFRARYRGSPEARNHDGQTASLPAPTARHAEMSLTEEELHLSADGPLWKGHTLGWPEGVGHFFIAGDIEVAASGPVEDMLGQIVFNEEGRAMFWMSIVPGVVGSGRVSFCLPQESAKAIRPQIGDAQPAWSSVTCIEIRAKSRVRGRLCQTPPSSLPTTAVISQLRLLALPA